MTNIDLLFDRYPHRVFAAILQGGDQQPCAACEAALGAEVEVPIGAGQAELVALGSRISGCRVDGRFRVGSIAVLDGLERVDAGQQWGAVGQQGCAKLHRNRAAELKAPDRINEVAAVSGFHGTADGRMEAVEGERCGDCDALGVTAPMVIGAPGKGCGAGAAVRDGDLDAVTAVSNGKRLIEPARTGDRRKAVPRYMYGAGSKVTTVVEAAFSMVKYFESLLP